MHPLVTLYKLQGRAVWRRATRNLRSVKGAVLGLFGVLVIVLWMAPSLWQAHAQPRTDPLKVREVAPVILLSMMLLGLVTAGSEKAVTFTPAEVDFLFPGPFTRRQLLAYKIGKAIVGVLLSATLMSVVFLRHATGWPQAWAGFFLAMLFLHLMSMAITLVTQSAGERAYTRTRKAILVGVGLAIAVAVWPAIRGGNRPGFFEVARLLRESRIGSVLLAPLKVFGRLFTATTWGEGLEYTGLALLINAVLLGVVFYLDADYLEAAAAKSQAMYARLQRLRKGGVMALGTPGKTARGAVPLLPYAGGAGPIAWRQMTTAIRNGRGMLLIMILLAIGVGPLLAKAKDNVSLSGSVVGVMIWMTLVVGAWLRFDFRGDLDQIDHLKSLPVSSWGVAAGQVLTPTLLMTLCHLIVVGSVMGMTRHLDGVLIAAAALCLPFNALLFGVENFIFLLFPTRTVASPADFQGYGRQILVFFAKGLLLLLAAGVAAAVAALLHFAGLSWPIAIAAGGVTLCGTAVGAWAGVAWAFARFDVAGDVPA